MGTGSAAKLVLLGAPCVVSAGQRHDMPETAPAYLGLFLAAQNGWVARESVSAYLWPDASTERAQHNLRVALNRLGALLQPWGLADALQAERRRLRLSVDSDLADFRAALAAGDWARAGSLPQGPLLDGLQCAPYPALAEWLSVEREALRRAWRKSLVEAAQTGTPVDGPLGRYVAAYPSDGEAASLLAARMAASGRPLEAQDVIASFRRAAADELSPGEVEAYVARIEQTAAALAPSGPGAESLDVLGRRTELGQLQAATRMHRWVTVVGLAGSGKSSLVRRWLAQRATDAPGERRVRVELNERSTAASTVQAMVSALATTPVPRRDPASPLAQLPGLAGLVVLDGLDPGNFGDELHALLHTMATACPDLRVVAASRAPLGVGGEQVQRLQGLSVRRPADGGRSDAAVLFLREAQRMRPNPRWAQLDTEVERIARLCDGLPLALKLAASWSRWLEPQVIAVELERSARRGAGAFDPSLHGWLAAPWQRLSAVQQQALHALSLFPGSFDMGAAVAVAAAPADAIEALQAQCLVEIEDDPGRSPRLRLHALVRAFAAAQRSDARSPRREAIGRFLVMVDARLGPRHSEGGQPIFDAAPVSACIDDVMAAWPLALETGALEPMQILASALLTWHEASGDYRVGAQRLALALDALDETAPAEAAVLARLHVARATLLYRAGDYDGAEVLTRHAMRLGEATGQRRVVRRALNVLGLSRWMTLQLDPARNAFEQGLASAIEDGESRGEAAFTSNLALIDKYRGDYVAAEAGLRRGVELARAMDAWSGAVSTLNNLANLLRHLRRFDEAEALAQECLRLTHEHALQAERPFALMGLALLQRACGRLDRAEQYLSLFDACPTDTVEGSVRTGALLLRARLALDRGDGATALQRIAQALRACTETDDAANRAEALMLYGQWLGVHDGRPDEALQLWAALLSAPSVQAMLKDELRDRLVGFDHTGPVPPAADVDLALCVEQALATARAHAGADA